jgi:hypothetical protein
MFASYLVMRQDHKACVGCAQCVIHLSAISSRRHFISNLEQVSKYTAEYTADLRICSQPINLGIEKDVEQRSILCHT